MVILIAGDTHTGKTLLAQKLLEKYNYPYLSIDHIKMGLIRSGVCNLNVNDDSQLTIYLWKIIKEIIKTNIENNQHIIIEGCYIPFDWKNDFENGYLIQIKYVCLIFSDNYLKTYFESIIYFENSIEDRLLASDIS